MTCPSRYFVGGCILTCALDVEHQGWHVEAGAEGCVRQGWPDPPPAPAPDDNPELTAAIAAVKRDLGVDAVMAAELAQRLPEHLRGPFWDRALDRYFGAKLGELDDPAATLAWIALQHPRGARP